MTSGVVDTERNNSSLNDLNVENQKLGQDEIAALKNSGKVRIAQAKGELVCLPPILHNFDTFFIHCPAVQSGSEIIDALCPSHSALNTFSIHFYTLSAHFPSTLLQSGSEIIEVLCSNSATFEAKTEFSQVSEGEVWRVR